MHSAKYLGNTVKVLLAILVLSACSKSWRPAPGGISYSNLRVDSAQFQPDSATEVYIAGYRRVVDSLTSRVIAASAQELRKGLPEGELGNLLTDLSMFYAPELLKSNPQACLYNNGGLRVPLPQGNITLGKLYELMPFDNRLVEVKLKGSVLKDLVRISARKGGDAWGGIRFAIDTPSNTMNALYIGSSIVEDSTVYTILTSDYVANGGDQYAPFQKSLEIKDTGWLLRDFYIRLFELETLAGRQLDKSKDGRIRYE